MGRLTVDSLKFMSTVSPEIYYRTAKYDTIPVASVYEVCVDKILIVYKEVALISTISTATMNF